MVAKGPEICVPPEHKRFRLSGKLHLVSLNRRRGDKTPQSPTVLQKVAFGYEAEGVMRRLDKEGAFCTGSKPI